MRSLALVIACLLLFSCSTREKADIVFINAKVWTGDSALPSASVVAIRDGKISYVGDDKDAVQSDSVIDLGGKMVMPGFMDNHTHFLSGGLSLSCVQLKASKTREAFIATIKEYCRTHPGDDWIQGGEWNNENWGGELPRHDWIDSVTGAHPVCISRYDGHMVLANKVAMDKAGLAAATKDVAGGSIGRDRDGGMTGIFRDNATDLVAKMIPAPSEKDLDQYLARATEEAVSHGVTLVNDVGSYGGWAELETYRRAYAKGLLTLRVNAMVPLSDWKKLDEYVKKNGRGDDHLLWGGLKGFVDGSLGSTTAWLYEPYLDDPGSRGFNITDTNDLKSWVKSADSAGLRVAVHAIGDRANDFILDAFAAAQQANGTKDNRFRIEHAQHLRQSTLDRFRTLGVVPSMHPYHVVDDGVFAPKRLDSARLKGTYAFRSLLELGVPVCFGSDWTVAPLNPLTGVYGAVTRRTSDGKNPEGWFPEQKISVEQALRCYTANNAYALFHEEKLGRIKKGMLADLAVIDGDLLTMAPEKIKDARVVMTLVEGKVVYRVR
jgi:predicted amidohydrolase YtcJ